MDPIKALILGFLQGILEWLPVSSQGNLVVLAISLLGLEPDYALNLSVYLHMSTGFAALIYFREEVVKILRRETERDQKLFRFLLIVTIVTGIVGFPIFVFVRITSFFGETLLALTGLALLATGFIQRHRVSNATCTYDMQNIQNELVLGIVQGLSAIPGLSRSGVTTTALLLQGLSGVEAFRISFLMSIPAVFAATFGLVLVDGFPQIDAGIIIALMASFISAIVSIDFLLKMARKISFWKLCMILGLIALVALFPFLF